jgi:hypothetical protein
MRATTIKTAATPMRTRVQVLMTQSFPKVIPISDASDDEHSTL